MALRVLGPLELVGEHGPVPLPAAKMRALLAALAIHRGRTCSADVLIDAIWGESPPSSAPKLLQVYMSKLRKVLPRDLRVVTDATGYRLELGEAALDVDRFEHQVADGRDALRAGNPALAVSILRRALALWRGPAFADVRYAEFAAAEADRLESLRTDATLDRIDADLRTGRHAEVLAELRAFVAGDRTDERAVGLAMLAAYRAHGAPEALAIFETARAAIEAELREAPGSALVELRNRIARREASLASDATPAAHPALPTPPNALIGRERELVELRSLLERPNVRLVSLTGAGGSGKSRLALELARTLEPRFANGAALVELAPVGDPSGLLPTIARALDAEQGGDPGAALASALRDRELLLVLDNLEHLRAAAVGLVGLLAAAPRVVIVATTRVVLHLSGEHVYPVGPLPPDDAVELFAERASAADPSFALDGATRPLVAAICRRVDGLPLAIELAAARVRTLGLGGLDERLSSRMSVLTGGPRDLPARQQTLRETLAWSVNLLGASERRVLAGLAVFSGTFPMDAARAVAGADDEVMTALVDHHLVQVLDVGVERRFRLLETVREYADELLGAERADAEAALVDWIIDVVAGTDLDIGPERQVDKLARLDAGLDSVRDTLRHAARDPDPTRELAIASGIWRFWLIRGHLAEGRAILDDLLERRGLVETATGVRAGRGAASIAYSVGDVDRAASLAEQVLAAALRVGDPIELAHAYNLAGVVANGRGDHEACERHHLEAIRIAEAIGQTALAGRSVANLATSYLDQGRLDEARERFQAILAVRRLDGPSEGLGIVHLNLGEVEFEAGDLAASEAHYRAAAESFDAVGFPSRLANAYQGLAAVEVRTGRAEAAARRLGLAAAMLGEIGWGGDGTALAPAATAEARAALGDEPFERLFAEGAGARDEVLG